MSQPDGETSLDGETPPTGRPGAGGHGHGGRRPGSGRKPRGVFAPLQGDIDFAKDLVSSLMRDQSQPVELRARCALAVLMRGSTGRGRRRSVYVDVPVGPDVNPGGPDRMGPGAGDPTAS